MPPKVQVVLGVLWKTGFIYRIYNVDIIDKYLEGTLGVQFYIKENVYTQYICHQKIPRGAVIPTLFSLTFLLNYTLIMTRMAW